MGGRRGDYYLSLGTPGAVVLQVRGYAAVPPRREVPPGARVLFGDIEYLIGEDVKRYRLDGCDYAIRWRSSD